MSETTTAPPLAWSRAFLGTPAQAREARWFLSSILDGSPAADDVLVCLSEKSRLHIDVNATDRDQDAELERLLKLGARPADIGQTGEEQWHVLADPEGNEFCLLKTRLAPL
jgi:hypothetical protein